MFRTQLLWTQYIVQLQLDVHNFNAHLHQFSCNSLRVFCAKQIFGEIYGVSGFGSDKNASSYFPNRFGSILVMSCTQ